MERLTRAGPRTAGKPWSKSLFHLKHDKDWSIIPDGSALTNMVFYIFSSSSDLKKKNFSRDPD